MAIVGLITGIILYSLQQRANRATQAATLIKKQLSELYGPVYTRMAASQHLYYSFRKCHHPEQDSYFSTGDYTKADVASCKACNKATSGEKAVDILSQKSYLIIEDQLPSCIPLYIAHCMSYDALEPLWASFESKQEGWPISAEIAREHYEGIVLFPVDFLKYFEIV